MAGDWIKFELTTMDKPEVCQIADLAGIDPDAVVGKLMRVWGWFDQQTENGNAPSVSKKLLDRSVGVAGFCDHMKSVGWMVEEGGRISLPRFDRHNGRTAKNRLLTAKRVANHKNANAKGNAPTVSDALPKEDVEKSKSKKQNPLTPKADSETAPNPAKKFDPETACPPNVTPSVWSDWVRCRKEQGKPLKETTCQAQAKQLAGHPYPDEVIRRSVAGGYQGLFPDRVSGNVHHLPNSRHTGFADRDYTAGLIAREDGTYGF